MSGARPGHVGCAVAEGPGRRPPGRGRPRWTSPAPPSPTFSASTRPSWAPASGSTRASDARGSTEARYGLEQATKPHTIDRRGPRGLPDGLGRLAGGGPRSWSGRGDDVESASPCDDLLTWVTLYRVTGAIGSSFAAYEDRVPPGADRLEVPTAVTVFVHDLVRAPREFGERFFDIRVWTEEPRGGRFVVWERPERFVAGLREELAIAG